MPIIALYGTKGGTGRTTAAAMLAQGLLSHGANVTLVETVADAEPRPLRRWSTDVTTLSDRGNQLSYAACLSSTAFTPLADSIGTDEHNFAIIDTERYDTKIRAAAFAIADLIIMPFTGFLDAKCGVKDAATCLPAGKDIVGFAMNADRELCARIHVSMPVLGTSLPNAPEFSLFSEAAKALTTTMLSKAHDPYAGADDLSLRLFELATEVRSRAGANMQGLIKRPAPAACSPGYEFQHSRQLM